MRTYRTFTRPCWPRWRSRCSRQGNGVSVSCHGWPDNRSYLNLAAWGWRLGEERRLIIVNLSEHRSQALVPLPWEDLAGRTWQLTEAFTGETYAHDGQELHQPGLFVDLEAWGFHFFQVA